MVSLENNCIELQLQEKASLAQAGKLSGREVSNVLRKLWAAY